MSIPEVIEKLKEKSEINPHSGMGGTEVVVEKELIRLASVYLEDFLLVLEKIGRNEE